MNHIDVTSIPRKAKALRVTADDEETRDAIKDLGLEVELDGGEWLVCLSDEHVPIENLIAWWILVETYSPEADDPGWTETHSFVVSHPHFRNGWVAVDKSEPAWTEPTLFDSEPEP